MNICLEKSAMPSKTRRLTQGPRVELLVLNQEVDVQTAPSQWPRFLRYLRAVKSRDFRSDIARISRCSSWMQDCWRLCRASFCIPFFLDRSDIAVEVRKPFIAPDIRESLEGSGTLGEPRLHSPQCSSYARLRRGKSCLPSTWMWLRWF